MSLNNKAAKHDMTEIKVLCTVDRLNISSRSIPSELEAKQWQHLVDKHCGERSSTNRWHKRSGGLLGIGRKAWQQMRSVCHINTPCLDTHGPLPRSQTSLFFEEQERAQRTKGRGKGERRRFASLLSPSRDPSHARSQFPVLLARLLRFCD